MSQASAFFDLNVEVSLSAGHDRMIVFARRGSGSLAHIDEVDNGKACGCVCLACREPLIARQGSVLAHSFAHASGTECDHALEAMLYGIIVELIERDRSFVTPALLVRAAIAGPLGGLSDVREIPATKVPVDAVVLAKRAHGSRPCVVASVRQRELLIRVALRRRAGEQRKASLAALGQAAIEIDLSKEFPGTVGELARILFTADPRKSWLCNPRAAALSAQTQAALTARAQEQRLEQQAAAKARQEQRLEQQAAAKARQEQRQREAAERVRHVAVAREPDARPESDVMGSPSGAGPVAKTGAEPVKPTKPANMSLNIEYRSREGRLWLLHSEGAEIFFRIEPAAEQALRVLERCGAVKEEGRGVYRISKEGWSGASIELNRSWLAVRSVSGSSESEALDDVRE